MQNCRTLKKSGVHGTISIIEMCTGVKWSVVCLTTVDFSVYSVPISLLFFYAFRRESNNFVVVIAL